MRGRPRGVGKNSAPGVPNLPLSSLPMEERDAKGGGLRYKEIGQASTQVNGIEAISFRLSSLSSQGELKNMMLSRRHVSGQSRRIEEHDVESEARVRTPRTITSSCSADVIPILNPPAQEVETDQLVESEARIDRGNGRARKRGKRMVYTCPMAGCTETTLRLKWHVLHQHAP